MQTLGEKKSVNPFFILFRTPQLRFCFDFPWPGSCRSFVENNCFVAGQAENRIQVQRFTL